MEIKEKLWAVSEGSTIATAPPKHADDELEEDIDVDRLGEEADDESQGHSAKCRSRKQKKPSIFDDPQLQPGIKVLQVSETSP